MIELEIVLKYDPLPSHRIWDNLLTALPFLGKTKGRANTGNGKIPGSRFSSILKRSRRPHFEFELSDEKSYGYHVVGNPDVSFFQAKGCEKDEMEAQITLFGREPYFISARLYDWEYDYWQNADDPFEYEDAGKNYDHLPMRDNGDPYPLNKMVIDTTENPGRRTFGQGYIAAVGSIMWLGPAFWERTGIDKNLVLAQEWLNITERDHGVIEIQAAPDVFTTDQGEERKIQHRLWELLFPQQPGGTA